MEQVIKFGIGFVTGRPNVCKVINNTYERLINQFKDSGKKVELTIFILFDLGYQFTTRIDFYGIIPNVYKDIKIKYITPEDMEEEKKTIYLGDASNLSNRILYVQMILEEEKDKEGEFFVNGDLNNGFQPYFRKKV